MVFLGNTNNTTLHSIATAVAGARVIWCAIEIVNIVFTAVSNLKIICIGNSMICSDIWHKYYE